MARKYKIYEFRLNGPNRYQSDRGTLHTLRSRFVIPPDMTDAQATQVVDLLGAAEVLPTDPAPVCPDEGVQGRKLIFIRQDGSSLSVVAPVRIDNTLVTLAGSIRAVLNTLTGTNPVVCVKLDGEFWPQLIDELSPTPPPARTPGTSSRPLASAGSKNFVWSGVFNYFSDATYGSQHLLPFRIASNTANAAPELYGNVLTNANVTPVAASPCPGTNPRTPRHYIVQSIVTQDGATVGQEAKIPVGNNPAPGILDIGRELAALPSTVCLSYKGESNDRLHRLL
jgi:hypothetical protein